MSSVISLPTAVGSVSFYPSHALSEAPKISKKTKIATSAIEIAQPPDPNRDRFLQSEPESPSLIPPETEPVLSAPTPDSPTPSPDTEQPEIKIPVRQIEVIGSTVFAPEQLNPIIEPLEGRSVTLEELQNAADAITQLYVSEGYVTSRAVLVEQEIIDGVIQIQVIEGRLQEIQVEGTQKLNTNYIRSRIQLGTAPPLRTDRIEDQLLLLIANPLIESINTSLQPGDAIGESILIVRVTEANPFSSNFSADNYSPPILGSERTGIELRYRNLTGIGDDISGSWKRSTTGGRNLWDFNYRVPLNPMDGTGQLRAFLSRSEFTSTQTFQIISQGEVTEERFDLDLSSDFEQYEISFRQPLTRSPRQEFALSFGFSRRNGQPLEALEAAGLPSIIQEFVQERGLEQGLQELGFFTSEGTSESTSVFRFGLDYVKRDLQGAWALRSQFNLGTDLFDATVREEPFPDSRFFSWLLQLQRVQRLGDDNLLIVQGDLQLTPDSLLPSEQFVIGGGQSLRGYRQNVRFGDNGFRISIEDRIALQKDENGVPTFQLAPFVDLGKVWNNPDNPVLLPAQTFLAGVGLGVLWAPAPNLSIRLDFTVPLINLDDRGTNAQDDGFYFSVDLRP